MSSHLLPGSVDMARRAQLRRASASKPVTFVRNGRHEHHLFSTSRTKFMRVPTRVNNRNTAVFVANTSTGLFGSLKLKVPAVQLPGTRSTKPVADDKIVFVAGATGRLGVRVVRELLKKGFKVRAGVRREEEAQRWLQLALSLGFITGEEASRLEIVPFDLMDTDSVKPAIGNAAKVVCTVGAPESEIGDASAPRRIDGDGSIALIKAAGQAGVKQFVLVTSLGTGKLGWPASVLNLFWGVLIWKRKAEEALEASGMNYLVVRPGGMERPTDDYKKTNNVRLAGRDTTFGGQVSRLQVAELVASAVASPSVATNKCVEVVAETDAPLLSYEELLSNMPTEIDLEQQAALKSSVAEAEGELEAAAAAVADARAKLAAAEERVQELSVTLKAAREQEGKVKAAAGDVLKAARTVEAAVEKAKAKAEAAEREEQAAKAVLEAARRAAQQGELMTPAEMKQVAAAARAPPVPPAPQPAAAPLSLPLFGALKQPAKPQVEEEEEESAPVEEKRAAPKALAMPSFFGRPAGGDGAAAKKAQEEARAEAEAAAAAERARKEAEAKAVAEAKAAAAKAEAEAKVKAEAEAKAKAEAAAKAEAEAKAKAEAEAAAVKAKAEAAAKAEAEAKAKAEAQAKAQAEAEAAAKAEAKAKAEAEAKAQAEAAATAKAEAEAKAQAEAAAKAEAEAKANTTAAAQPAYDAAAAARNKAEAQQWIANWKSKQVSSAPAAAATEEPKKQQVVEVEARKEQQGEASKPQGGAGGAGGGFLGIKWPLWGAKEESIPPPSPAAPAAAPAPKAAAAAAPSAAPAATTEVPANVAEAREWISNWRSKQQQQQAGEQGSPVNQALDGAGGKVVPENVAQAREWIRRWRAKQLEAQLPVDSKANL